MIASKMILNSDSVPQSINLEGSDIRLANTVRSLCVGLGPTLFPAFFVCAIWNFVGLVQYAAICPKVSHPPPPTHTHCKTNFQNNHIRPRHSDMLHSLRWLPIEQRIEYKLSLLCVKIIFSPGAHLPFRTSSPLHSCPAAQLFCKQPCV